MTIASFAQLVLWVLCPTQQTLIGVAMARRQQIRSFPIFFTYLVFHVLQFIVAFVSYRVSYSAYFGVYWTSEVIDAFLTLAVIQEVFQTTFEPYDALRNLGVLLFRWVTIILCIVSILSASVAPGTESDRLIAGFLVLQRSVQLLQGGLILFLFLFCRLFGMTWRHYVFGIAAGFALISSLMTVAGALRTQLGSVGDPWYGLVQACAFNMGLLVWLWHFRFRNNPIVDSQLPDSGQLTTWNRALLELQR